jgi:hypothetical protein
MTSQRLNSVLQQHTLTDGDRASLLSVLRQGKWSFVGLHLVNADGTQVYWSSNERFGETSPGEKHWPLGPDDAADDYATLFSAIADSAAMARDQGYWRLCVRFYGATSKDQIDRIIALNDRKAATGGSDALDIQTSKMLIEAVKNLGHAASTIAPTVERAYSGAAEAGRENIRIIQEENRMLRADLNQERQERREVTKENAELRKRVRELEEEAGPMVLALKAMDSGNMAGQAAIMSTLRGLFGALQAGNFKEALVKFGKEGMDGLDELTKAIPDAPPAFPSIEKTPEE